MATYMFFGLWEEAEPTQTQEERADSTQEGSVQPVDSNLEPSSCEVTVFWYKLHDVKYKKRTNHYTILVQVCLFWSFQNDQTHSSPGFVRLNLVWLNFFLFISNFFC